MYNKIRSLGVVCSIVGIFFIIAFLNIQVGAAANPWAPNTAYAVGNQVTYNGCTYQNIQSHTSQIGWEPPYVPALWNLLSCGAAATSTSTKTNTPAAAATATKTPTRTNTAAGPAYTATRTNTPAAPANTATRTATRANSPTAQPVSATNTPAGGTGCTAPWNGTSAYTQGNTVSENARNYRANWWNQNERPSTSTTGVWSDQGTCAAPTPGPTSQAGGGLPNRVSAIYADISFTSIQSAYQATGAKYYAVAFVLAKDGACTPAWDGVHPMSANYYASQINAVRAGGGDVIAVFGGANGSDIATTCTTVGSLQAAFQTVINQYHFKWIDLNIEGTLISDFASLDRRNKAIAALQAANPGLKVSYTLPVMQSGLLQTALSLLDNAKSNGVRIDYVNIMTMNYGPSGIDMGQAAISAVTNTRNQLVGLGINAQIGITPMNGQNNTAGEIFTLSDADEVIAFARANSYVGWLSFWSLGRDNGSCAGNTTASASCSGIAQNNYEFTSKFKAFP